MTAGQPPPDDVLDAIKMVRKLKGKKFLTREEGIDLNRAKLRVAYWACRSENIIASKENLAYVLGSDAHDIMAAYEKYLDMPKDRDGKKDKKRRDGKQFWGDL